MSSPPSGKATWGAALGQEPTALDSLHFGWETDHVIKCLMPWNVCHGTAYAPENIHKLVCTVNQGRCAEEANVLL